MAYTIITIPFDKDKKIFDEADLNRFCLNKKILSQRVEFFSNQTDAYWTVFFEYETVGESDEFNDIKLNEAENLLFQRLREWRQKEAEKQGVPVFIISTNRMLKEIAISKPSTLEALKTIRGLGKKKIERYGNDLLEIISAFIREE